MFGDRANSFLTAHCTDSIRLTDELDKVLNGRRFGFDQTLAVLHFYPAENSSPRITCVSSEKLQSILPGNWVRTLRALQNPPLQFPNRVLMKDSTKKNLFML